MTGSAHSRRISRPSGGFTLVEVIVMLALIGTIVPALLVAFSTAARLTDHSYDRSVLFELAQSQLEDVQTQPYQTIPASYPTVTAPAGYSITVDTSLPVTYTYPAPSSTSTAETIQQVTVTVTGVRGSLTIVGYKLR